MSSLSCWGPVVIYHLWEGGTGNLVGSRFSGEPRGTSRRHFVNRVYRRELQKIGCQSTANEGTYKNITELYGEIR